MKFILRSIPVYLLLTFCSTPKKVPFKNYVDTSSKKIKYQNKQTYITTSGVSASNQFDGARLNGFTQLNDSTFSVRITPENVPINNSPYYSFKLWSKTPKTTYIQFDYPEGFKHRYSPKININGNWEELDSTLVSVKDDITSIKLKLSKDTTWVSAQKVVSYKDTRQWVDNAIKGLPYVKLSFVGKTNLGKDLPVLDIYKGDKKNKPIIILMTRQHPPEVTGFFAFQEFLSTILKENELSTEFLNTYRILVFPIMNPDGVDMGHWRHNANGVDLNRDWSRYNQIEVKNTATFITKEMKSNNSKIVLGLDFHSTWYDVFYTNKKREGTTFPKFIEDWFAGLEKNIPGYKVNEAPGNSTKPVSKGWFLYGHNAVGITYEIGDKTPLNEIQRIGKVSAEEMMRILTQK
ncbi:MAG: M14 family metallopeptidase [Polaribacter sp.]